MYIDSLYVGKYVAMLRWTYRKLGYFNYDMTYKLVSGNGM
jgi:hypothetical protein